MPLGSAEIQRRLPTLAPEIFPRQLGSAVLESGRRVEGFLIFPDGDYDGAVVTLIDVETKEPEEFEVTFP